MKAKRKSSGRGNVNVKCTSIFHGEGSIAITNFHYSFLVDSHFIVLIIVAVFGFMCSDDSDFSSSFYYTCTILISFAI